jgi:hypothetical protein
MREYHPSTCTKCPYTSSLHSSLRESGLMAVTMGISHQHGRRPGGCIEAAPVRTYVCTQSKPTTMHRCRFAAQHKEKRRNPRSAYMPNVNFSSQCSTRCKSKYASTSPMSPPCGRHPVHAASVFVSQGKTAELTKQKKKKTLFRKSIQVNSKKFLIIISDNADSREHSSSSYRPYENEQAPSQIKVNSSY